MFSRSSYFALIGSLVLLCAASAAPFTASAGEVGGYIDGLNTANTLASNSLAGWAYDPRNPNAAVYVEVDADGTLIGTVTPSVYRTDVANAFGIDAYHGFLFPLPNTLFDGAAHTIRAYSVNADTGGKTELGGSPFSFTRLDPGVTGYIDTVSLDNPSTPQTFVHGWVFDNADHARSVPVVAFTTDYTGVYLGSDVADRARADVNTAYGAGDAHGYAVPLDLTGYSSGDVVHVAVYAIDRTIGELKSIGTIAYQIP